MSKKSKRRALSFQELVSKKTEPTPAPTHATYSLDIWQRAMLICFHFLLFVTPLFFTWVNEELFEFNKMLIVYASAVVIGALWLGRMLFFKRVIFQKTIFTLPLLGFITSQVLSTVFSMHVHTSLFGYYTRFHGGLLSTLSYSLLFFAFVSNINRKQLKNLFATLFISAGLVTLMAIPEHFGHSMSCLIVNTTQQAAAGQSDVYSLSTLARNYNASCWIQDVQNRVFATFGQPNWLAAYAILLIPLSISLTLMKGKRAVGYGVLSVLLFLTLIFTKSRSGMIGLFIGLVVFGIACLIGLLRHQKQTNQTSSLIRLSICAAALGVCVIAFGTPFTPNLIERYVSSKSATQTATPQPTPAPTSEQTTNRLDVGGTDSGDIRKIVWTGAWRVFKRYPVFGSGVETFAYSYYLDRPVEHNLVSEWDFLYNKAHNEFLNFLATTGVVGLAAYCVMLSFFIGVPLWDFIQKIRQSTGDEEPFGQLLFGPALAAGIIALSISNALGFSTVMVSALLFLFPAWYWSTTKAGRSAVLEVQLPPRESSEEMRFSMGQVAGLGMVGVFAVMFLFSIYTIWKADNYYATGKQLAQTGHLQEGVDDLQNAIQLEPHEASYYEQLALTYSQVVGPLNDRGDATAAAQLAALSQQSVAQMLSENSVNVNNYKSAARVFLFLSQWQPKFMEKARDSLIQARKLAPTDAKVLYNLAIIEIGLGDTTNGVKDLEETVRMKSNYEAARVNLGEQYQKAHRFDDALAQYQFVIDHIQPNDEKALAGIATISAELKKQHTP